MLIICGTAVLLRVREQCGCSLCVRVRGSSLVQPGLASELCSLRSHAIVLTGTASHLLRCTGRAVSALLTRARAAGRVRTTSGVGSGTGGVGRSWRLLL